MRGARRVETVVIPIVVLLLVLVPVLRSNRPVQPAEWLALGLVLLSGFVLVGWRTHPQPVVVVGLTASVAADLIDAHTARPGGVLPGSALLILTALCTLAGSIGVARGLGPVVAFLAISLLVEPGSPVGLAMFTVPGFVVGAVYRARNETSRELATRAKELEAEQEAFAQLARRHERTRIAAELHDIIGHAMSVMVIQAAAGQRLSGVDSERTRQTFDAIAESARQGRRDLARLVDLLGGDDVPGPDLALIDELVHRAVGSGLSVSCVVDADRSEVDAAVAHVAFRVVQESLTNALRHAPGADVNAYVGMDGDHLAVRIENDAPTTATLSLVGTQTGLAGLRQRVEDAGGRLHTGPTSCGGWLVEATIPVLPVG